MPSKVDINLEQNDDGTFTIRATKFPAVRDPDTPIRTRTETAPSLARAMKKLRRLVSKGDTEV